LVSNKSHFGLLLVLFLLAQAVMIIIVSPTHHRRPKNVKTVQKPSAEAKRPKGEDLLFETLKGDLLLFATSSV
jgi:hypothetical protein